MSVGPWPRGASGLSAALRAPRSVERSSRALALRPRGLERVVWGAFLAFGAIPLLLLLAIAESEHGALTSATGIFPGDRPQYLAWVPDAAVRSGA